MYILFDIGGTNMRITASRDGKTFEEPKKVPTPQNFDDGIQTFTEIAKYFAGEEAIDAVAGGIAGPLNKERTMLINSPHISGWIDKPLKASLENALRAPIFIENDNAIVGLGEMTSGSGAGYGIGAYIGVGTGVGGTRYMDGVIDRNAFGFEIGHQIIDADGSLNMNTADEVLFCTGCGQVGHLEGYISGKSFEKRYGKKAYEITDPDVWEESARILAYGVYNTMIHWSPDVLVLGGSIITGNPAISVDRVTYYMKKITVIVPTLPEIKKAYLGDVGGLYGALTFLKQKMN